MLGNKWLVLQCCEGSFRLQYVILISFQKPGGKAVLLLTAVCSLGFIFGSENCLINGSEVFVLPPPHYSYVIKITPGTSSSTSEIPVEEYDQ